MNRRDFVASTLSAAGLAGTVVPGMMKAPEKDEVLILRHPRPMIQSDYIKATESAKEIMELLGCKVVLIPDGYDLQRITRTELSELIRAIREVRLTDE